MKQYKPIESKPLMISYHDYEILTPPLCSGGLTSLQILKIVENLSIAKENKQGSAEFFHYLVEIMKLSWKERLTKNLDPEFTSLDQEAQLSRKTIQKLSDTVKQSADNPTNDKTIASARPSSTSHICAADDEGNFVSMTHTLGGSLGSLMTIPGTGIVLGHGLSRFDPNPGLPNSVGPRKQPLHNMCPMLMTRNQKMVAAFGAPGGRMIVNNMVQLVVNMVDYRKLPAAALSLPRCHVESTEPLQLERSAGKSTLDKVRKLGHKVVTVERLASPAHIIMKRSMRLVGATDPRGEGKIARL
ncbi:MAG: gamma-glutamyltransferase, partial [Nitrososphaerales archaeon]